MKVIRTRLDLHANGPRHCFALLRVEILKSDLRFRDGVEVGIDNDHAQDGVLVICAIEFKKICIGILVGKQPEGEISGPATAQRVIQIPLTECWDLQMIAHNSFMPCEGYIGNTFWSRVRQET